MLKDIIVTDEVWKGEKKEVVSRKVKAFILKEDAENYVYIPLKALMRPDYERLKKIAKDSDGDLLEAMRDVRLDNGMLALNLYKDSISVQKKEVAPKKPAPTVLTETAIQEPAQEPTSVTEEEPRQKRKYVRKA